MLEPGPAEAELFVLCVGPLISICRPALDQAAISGYFNVLSDLPGEAVFAAASELAATRQYPTWPMPGEIRAAAVRMIAPQMTAGEAWRIAQIAARRLCDEWIDFHDGVPVAEWNEGIWAKLPPAVAMTLRLFGGRKLADTTTQYAQFRDEYERQVAIVRQPLMRPKRIHELVAQLAQRYDGALAIEQSLSPAAMRLEVAKMRKAAPA